MNNIYGILGIGVSNGNFNAGFDGFPKQNGEGVIIASPYSLQWMIKKYWNDRDFKVFGVKTEKGESYCSLKEKYEMLFDKDKKSLETRNNLLSCVDVKNFGIVYTGKNNMAIRGVSQLSMGINKFKDTNIIEENMLSPFVNKDSKEVEDGKEVKEKKMTTIGSRVITDEAHYIYDFSIFPKEYDKYINDEFEGYTNKDYEDFKVAALKGVTFCDSKSKKGCFNEFGLFIKVREEFSYLIGLSNLNNLVSVSKDENKVIYDLEDLSNLINGIGEDKIENVEIYYNNFDSNFELKGWNFKNTKIYNIFTMEEI